LQLVVVSFRVFAYPVQTTKTLDDLNELLKMATHSVLRLVIPVRPDQMASVLFVLVFSCQFKVEA